MTNEFTINSGIKLANGNLKYQSQTKSFRADQTVAKGPSPGSVTIGTSATNIDLTELTLPGLCQITNIGPTNYVEIGIEVSSTFHPFLKLLPGESFPIRLATLADQLQAKAHTAPIVLQFDGFDT